MEHFSRPLTRAESDGFADRIEAAISADGYGLWAVEVSGGAPFIGFVGLAPPSFEAHFTPAVEVGWRLDRHHWGNGYATEAARQSLSYAFEQVGLDEVVSFAVPQNRRSRLVMERIGLTHDEAGDFEHPRHLDDDRLRRHVLYRITRERWLVAQ
jgi:RimJ/RimL family protein N-acetyltransferase